MKLPMFSCDLPVNRWEIAITPPGDVTATLRDEDGKTTDIYKLKAGTVVAALRKLILERRKERAVIEAANAYERIDAEPPYETNEAFENWSDRRANASDVLCKAVRALDSEEE